MKIQTKISNSSYVSGEGFIGKYRKLIKDTAIPYQYEVLNDNAEGAEKSHVVSNFINAAKALDGEENDGFYGMVFQDSDAAKWIEAAAYSLAQFPDAELEKKIDGLIDLIAAAQDEDGYLDTYFTIKDKDKRWKNLMEGHELYCAGHMMEAACAYYEATGKDKLMKVCAANARHIYGRFMDEDGGLINAYPGHPEIELALLKMYRTSGDAMYLELAEHFIDVRGKDPEFYEKEALRRDWTVWGCDPKDHDYTQSAKPVREQSDATGHAVRAAYLYTAMAELAAETDDERLMNACRRLWESVTQRRMYVTGGIGSTVIGEAFSTDYDLPDGTAYCETCASIGLMFFASGMLESDVNGVYSDVMERAFYNSVLSGMSLDAKRFFYVNPLECVPGISGVSPTHRHALTQRPGWYTCACCPPNLARLISSLGKYAYGENESTAYCHLYADGEISFKNGLKLRCETEYPYGFEIRYTVLSGSGKLALRIPSWSESYELRINGKTAGVRTEKGYVYIGVSPKDEIVLLLDSKPYKVYASSKAPSLTGRTAVCRGPLVYCFEGADNQGDVLSLSLKRDGELKVLPYDDKLLGGTVKIISGGIRRADSGQLYSSVRPEESDCECTAVPYYAWCNRGENQMRVWMNEE